MSEFHRNVFTLNADDRITLFHSNEINGNSFNFRITINYICILLMLDLCSNN